METHNVTHGGHLVIIPGRDRPPLTKQEIRRKANYILYCTKQDVFNTATFHKEMTDADYKFVSDPNLEKYIGVQGLYMRWGVLVNIHYEASLRPGRRRFTVAHELGHRFLHDPGTDNSSANEDRKGGEKLVTYSPILEREADMFAAEILMPYHIICEEVQRLRISPESIETSGAAKNLAKIFGVSNQAMEIRLRDFTQEHLEA